MRKFNRYLRLLTVTAVMGGIVFVAMPSASVSAAVGTQYKFQLPLGPQVISNPTASTALTMPTGTKHAIITVRTNGVMLRDDGTAPTSSVGLYLPAGTVLKVDNDRQWLTAMRFINSSDGATTLYVAYYGDR